MSWSTGAGTTVKSIEVSVGSVRSKAYFLGEFEIVLVSIQGGLEGDGVFLIVLWDRREDDVWDPVEGGRVEDLLRVAGRGDYGF